jgi:hypothetical protein
MVARSSLVPYSIINPQTENHYAINNDHVASQGVPLDIVLNVKIIFLTLFFCNQLNSFLFPPSFTSY